MEIIPPEGQVVNFSEIDKLHKSIIADCEKFNKMINSMYDKVSDWKKLKLDLQKEANEVLKSIKSVSKAEGKISSNWKGKIANSVSRVVFEAKKMRYCELELKKGRQHILENSGVKKAMQTSYKAKEKLNNINRYCVEGIKDPKLKKHKSDLQKIIDTINKAESSTVVRRINLSRKTAKYSEGNANIIWGLKSVLKTMVENVNNIFDMVEDHTKDIIDRNNCVQEFEKNYELNKKNIGDKISALKFNNELNSELSAINALDEATKELQDYLEKNKILVELDKIIKSANKNKILTWICSHAYQILMAVGFIVSLL